MNRIIPKFNQKTKTKTKLTISTTPKDHEAADIASTSLQLKPIVKSPDWDIRYDPTLSVYYYVNEKTNQTQFDHPDEVVSPIESPLNSSSNYYNTSRQPESDGATSLFKTQENGMDYRKSTFGSTLKRTLSPKFLQGNSLRRKQSPSSNNNSPRLQQTPIMEEHNNQDQLSINDPIKENDNEVNEIVDEDVEEFKRLLELEMKNYESERLKQ